MLKKNKTYQVVYIASDGVIVYEFTRTKDLLELVDRRSLEDKESFHFDNVIGVINTNDVLTSLVDAHDLESAFLEAFPAFKQKELYIDFQKSASQKVAIIKKEKLEALIEKHDLEQLHISQWRLGTTVSALYTDFNDTHFETSDLAELAVASFITQQVQENNFDGLEVLFRESRTNKRTFEIIKWSAIAVFLVGLLVNFYFHEHYRKELGLIQQQQVSTKQLEENIQLLQDEIKTKEFLLRSDNSTDINRLRFLNNHLAATGNVVLQLLTYQPSRSSIENDEKIKLHENRVIVIGKAAAKTDFNAYINHLEQLTSIHKVSIINVEESIRQITFELQIQLEDELR